MAKRERPDLDERFGIDAEPEDVLRRILSGAGTEGDAECEPESEEAEEV